MIDTIVIYFSVLFLSTLSVAIGNNQTSKGSIFNFIFTGLGLILIIVIGGVRALEVGVDNFYYYLAFIEFNSSTSIFDTISYYLVGHDYDPLFSLIYHISHELGLGYWSVNLAVQIIICTCLYLVFRTQNDLLFLGVFFFITTGFWFTSFNGLRQSVAIALILTSIIPLYNKKYIKFILIIIVATLFHRSALFFALILPILPQININGHKLWIPLMLVALVVPVSLIENIIIFFSDLFPYTNYSRLFLKESPPIPFSIGIAFQVGTLLLLAYFGNSIIKNDYEKLVVNVTLFGGFLYCLFFSNVYLIRFVIMFTTFQIISLSYLIRYNFEIRNNNFNYIVISVYTAWFIYRVYTGDSGVTPYSFYQFN